MLVADPPWRFDDSLPGRTRGAARNYRTLAIDQIRAFALPPLADDCALLLWRVAAMQEEALSVVKAWGFAPKSEIVWVKRTRSGKRWFGMGRQVRSEHEVALIATRGRPRRRSASVRSTFEAVVGRHSEKPAEFYAIVERLYDGPYVELFARRRRDGWACFGDELSIEVTP